MWECFGIFGQIEDIFRGLTRGLDFEVLLFGDRFAQGVSSDQFVLPALGEAEFNMTVTTSFVSSFGRLISRMGGAKLESIEYEIVGTVFREFDILQREFIEILFRRHPGNVREVDAQREK